MRDDDDVVEPGVLDVSDHRVDALADRQRAQIARLASTAGQVDSQHVEIWCLPVDFVDGELPAVAGVRATVY
jgi:hypothetical protein